MGFSESFEGGMREVVKSGKNVYGDIQWNKDAGIAGNAMDTGMGLVVNTGKETVRLTSLGIWNVMAWTFGKTTELLGSTVRLGGKALLAIPTIPGTAVTPLQALQRMDPRNLEARLDSYGSFKEAFKAPKKPADPGAATP